MENNEDINNRESKIDNKTIILIAIIAVLAIVAIFMAFKLYYSTNPLTGKAIDTSGWTENEIMNYDMHGTIPARAQSRSSAPSSSGGMVGGC